MNPCPFEKGSTSPPMHMHGTLTTTTPLGSRTSRSLQWTTKNSGAHIPAAVMQSVNLTRIPMNFSVVPLLKTDRVEESAATHTHQQQNR